MVSLSSIGSCIELGVTGFEGWSDFGVEGEAGTSGVGWLMLRDIVGENDCPVMFNDIGAIDCRCGGGGGNCTIRALDVDLDLGKGGRGG